MSECRKVMHACRKDAIFRTLKQRGHDPIRTIVKAPADYVTTGKLPPLPQAKPTSDR